MRRSMMHPIAPREQNRSLSPAVPGLPHQSSDVPPPQSAVTAVTQSQALPAEEVRQLDEESIAGAAELVGPEEEVAAEAGAVPGEEHGARRRLVGEEPVHAQPAAFGGSGGTERAIGETDENRVAGARVVTQCVDLEAVVL